MHSVKWYYESVNPTVQFCDGYYDGYYSCSIGKGTAVDYGDDKWDYTLTVVWNGDTITSGVLSQSNNNGDHVYRFHLEFGSLEDTSNRVMRNRYHTITGKCIMQRRY